MDEASLAFLVEPAGRGMTVLLLGEPDTALIGALHNITGPTGLVIAVSQVARALPPTTLVRAEFSAIPVRSHIADVVLLTTAAGHEEPDSVVEESRRLLAPGGVLHAVATLEPAYRLLGELHTAGFRDAEARPLGKLQGIRARGPR